MTRPSRFLCPDCAKRHSLAVSHSQNLGGETGAGKDEVQDDEEEQVSCWECEMFKKPTLLGDIAGEESGDEIDGG